MIADRIADHPRYVLGLATGSTPSGVYRELAPVIASEAIPINQIHGFALDEYVGLPGGHPQSYHAVLEREVVRPLGMTEQQLSVPEEGPFDLETAARNYEHLITARGGIDLQILGIGGNGHIGFNEPGSAFDSLTRPVKLDARTRLDNARFFQAPADVPEWCLTQGIGTILRARHLALLAFGAAKAQIVAAALDGPITPDVPASALRLHPSATVILDSDAAALLQAR
jgi:glucosamine-6-phosphate deaminase